MFLFVAAVLLGFVAGVFLTGGITSCTEIGCFCQEDGGLPCNTCTHEDPVFALGIINIIEVCDAKEILICENGEMTRRTYDLQGNCKVEAEWFDFVLNYME
jgi:hypothetical protein